MDIKDLKQKPIWQMTGEELLYLQQYAAIPQATTNPVIETTQKSMCMGLLVSLACLDAVCPLPIASKRVAK